jgi:(R,R)-butanediol dehydrogenase/meso-butanediol dehydrogenase/diacetyl reductase
MITMKAAVYRSKQLLDVTDIPKPEPAAGQVLIKVNRSAICGTDVHAFMYDLAPIGAVLGHEFAGVISAIGAGVTRWKEGDRVIGGGGEWPVGQEPPATSHPRYNYRTMGFSTNTRTRGYAEYTVLDDWAPLLIPDGVPDEAAALTEPCSVAVHAVRRSSLKLGDTVGVFGAGPIGLLVTQAARAAGAQVIVSEPAPGRSEAAMAVGAMTVIDPFEQDPVERMVELTNGRGPNVVFDCAGLKNTLQQAFDAVRREGQVVLVAVPWEPLPLLPAEWMAREIDFRSSWGGSPEDWQISLDLLASGKISASSLMSDTSTITLDEIQNTFEALMSPTTQLQTIIRM